MGNRVALDTPKQTKLPTIGRLKNIKLIKCHSKHTTTPQKNKRYLFPFGRFWDILFGARRCAIDH